MAEPNVGNILKTGAVLWLAPAGEALPSGDDIAAGAAWGGNWARVGFTKAPVAVKYEDEEHEIEVEEFLAAVDRVRIKESILIETVLAEVTGDYLKLGAGGVVTSVTATASVTGKDILEAGNDNVKPKFVVGFEGTYVNAAGVSLPVRFFVHRATIKLNGELTFSKKNGEYSGVPVQIAGLGNTTGSPSGRLFKFEKITAPKTV
jgi:hypothetical protein